MWHCASHVAQQSFLNSIVLPNLIQVTHSDIVLPLCSATLCAMAELHHVSTFAIVACNVAGIEASSTSATFHATTALRLPPAALHTMVWCNKKLLANQISFFLHVMLQRVSTLSNTIAHNIAVACNVASCVQSFNFWIEFGTAAAQCLHWVSRSCHTRRLVTAACPRTKITYMTHDMTWCCDMSNQVVTVTCHMGMSHKGTECVCNIWSLRHVAWIQTYLNSCDTSRHRIA